MGLLDSLLAFVLTPFVMVAAFLGTKHAPALFYPAKPQLFSFRRRSPPVSAITNSSNGADKPGFDLDPSEDSKTELLSIRDVLETRVPSALEGYAPSWWLPNGHAQTAYVVAGNFTKVDQLVYERYVSFTSLDLRRMHASSIFD